MEEKQANELRRKEEEKRERQEVLKLQLRKWKEEDNSKVKSKEATDVTRRRASSADPGMTLIFCTSYSKEHRMARIVHSSYQIG